MGVIDRLGQPQFVQQFIGALHDNISVFRGEGLTGQEGMNELTGVYEILSLFSNWKLRNHEGRSWTELEETEQWDRVRDAIPVSRDSAAQWRCIR